MESTIYPHIENIYTRDIVTNKLTEKYRLPEFKYLESLQWIATEKVDGTNIRIMWIDGKLTFNGKTDNAQIHGDLVRRINEVIKNKEGMCIEKFADKPVIIYCEGYGAGIQSGGQYSATKELVVFDVKIGSIWLDRGGVTGIADLFGLKTVPIPLIGTLPEIVQLVKNGLISAWNKDLIAEGVVARPLHELTGEHGRIICKIKHRDFKKD